MSLRRNELLSRLNRLQQRIVLEAGRMEFKVGDIYKCPEGHTAKIVWVSEDKKLIAVKCPQKHLSKVEKVANDTKPVLPYRRHNTKERKIYVNNIVFLIRI